MRLEITVVDAFHIPSKILSGEGGELQVANLDLIFFSCKEETIRKK